jgi:hypothetical protein
MIRKLVVNKNCTIRDLHLLTTRMTLDPFNRHPRQALKTERIGGVVGDGVLVLAADEMQSGQKVRHLWKAREAEMLVDAVEGMLMVVAADGMQIGQKTRTVQ